MRSAASISENRTPLVCMGQEGLFGIKTGVGGHHFHADAENVVMPKLKPSTRSISIRLPESMIEELKVLANKRDVPYQSLLKIFISERIDAERHH